MEAAIATLKKRGYRITAARKALLQTLDTIECPHTIPELVVQTASNEVSVYRNINLFTKENLVEMIHTNDPLPRYIAAQGHHHHIACTKCPFVAHIPCTGITNQIRHETFASISHHEVTYYGICKNCCSSS